MVEQIITREYLQANPTHIFVFGDNLLRIGTGGAAKLRDMKNTYGFITKKSPSYWDTDYYTPEEYDKVYYEEMAELKLTIAVQPEKTFLISKVGAGIANKFQIWEKIIEPRIKHDLKDFKNVKFLW